jgi:hypothetical protein
MKIRKLVILFGFGWLLVVNVVFAGEHDSPQPSKAYPHPVLSEDPSWASKVLIGSLAAFIFAIGVGVISKYFPALSPDPEFIHDDHAHDDHGASHH